jgi:phosphoribosylformylglycinamidine synthase
MSKVKVIVLTGYGTNCENEMAHACKLGGADQIDIVHISELLHGEYSLDDYHFLNLPGGFLDGDDLGAGQAGAFRFRYATVKPGGEKLFAQFLRFIEAGKLILGVCNGFQLMVKMGLLPGFNHCHEERLVSLTYNDSSRFEDRWVHLKVDEKSPCVFTKGLSGLYYPIRHGEGKFVAQDEATMQKVLDQNLVALRYVDPEQAKQQPNFQPTPMVPLTVLPESATRQDVYSALCPTLKHF